MKKNGVKFSRQTQVVERRKRVINRLESQLKSNTKTSKEGVLPLSEKDINRIKQEITILSERI